MTRFLHQSIPERAEPASLIKTAVQYKVEVDGSSLATPKLSKRHHSRKIECGLKWGPKQEASFPAIKQAIIKNVVCAGDETTQYHLMTDVLMHAIGGVLVLLPNNPAGTKLSTATKTHMKVIMFILKRLLPAETRYSTPEWEALAIRRGLEEVSGFIIQFTVSDEGLHRPPSSHYPTMQT